jgi:hypothetical protein
MNHYVPQEPRSLFGAAAVALTVLTMAMLVVGPAMLPQRQSPIVLPDVTVIAPATQQIGTAPRMEVVLDRAAYIEVARDSAPAPRRAHRG